MAYIERHQVTVTTGTATGTGYTPVVNGFVLAIVYTKTDYAAGVDFTVTGETSGIIIWDQDNVDATVTVYPRGATCDTAGLASLYAGSGEPVEDRIPVAQERIKIAIAAGGNGKTGVFDVYVGA